MPACIYKSAQEKRFLLLNAENAKEQRGRPNLRVLCSSPILCVQITQNCRDSCRRRTSKQVPSFKRRERQGAERGDQISAFSAPLRYSAFKTLTIELEESTEAQMAMPLRGHHSLVYLWLEKTRLTHSMYSLLHWTPPEPRSQSSHTLAGCSYLPRSNCSVHAFPGWSESKNGRSCCSMGTAAVPNDPRVAMEPNRM